MDDRRDGVEKGEFAFAGDARMPSASAGEVRGPVAMMTLVPVRGRQARDLLRVDSDERIVVEGARDGCRKTVAIDGERAASGELVARRRSA